MKVYLVDFNPWGEVTDPLLFEWEELNHWNNTADSTNNNNNNPSTLEQVQQVNGIEMRIVESQLGIRPSLSMQSRLPYELRDMSDGSAMVELIEQMKESGELQ